MEILPLPNDAVLTKEDYELYDLHRRVFTTTLQSDLVSKTFLFLGFGFTDPNIDYILSRIRILVGTGAGPLLHHAENSEREGP